MKKVIIFTFLIMLILCMPAQAEEFMAEGVAYDYTVEENDDAPELFAMSSDEKRAVTFIARCLKNRQETISLLPYNINKSRAAYLYTQALYEVPEAFYAPERFYYYWNGSNIILRFDVVYPNSTNVNLMIEEIEKEKETVLSMIDGDMTDLEKTMLVHNYIVTNHEYDYSYSIYDIHGFFTQRTGVCSAYAKAMTYLLRAAGVECSFARSDEMNHVWNVVKIDGSWYHVDATWDDPNDRVGYCSYKYFLKSDTYFEDYGGHYSWESEYAATSAWYDDYYFGDYITPFIYYEGEWYVKNKGGIYKVSHLKYGGTELVYTPELEYSGYWSYMGFGIYNGYFVFNLNDGVYVYNPKDYAKQRQIASCEENSVYSLTVWGDTVRYQTGSRSYELDEQIVLNLDDLVSDCYFELIDTEYGDGMLNVSYTYDEFYDRDWSIYVAAYDGDNTLICIKELPEGQYSIEIPEAEGYSAFIWEGCMPLCDSVSAE